MNQSFVLPNTSLVSMSFSQRDDHGFSPLHWACREGRSAVVEMLIMRGARINVMNRGDDTPLHLAASHGHRDIVQKLLQYKADINAVNEHGNVPLHYACFWGQDQVAEDLVANGALVSICNKYGEMPVDKAKAPLRELLRGSLSTPTLSLVPPCIFSLHSTIKAKTILFL